MQNLGDQQIKKQITFQYQIKVVSNRQESKDICFGENKIYKENKIKTLVEMNDLRTPKSVQLKLARIHQILTILEKDSLSDRYVSFKKQKSNKKIENYKEKIEIKQQTKKCPPLNLVSLKKQGKNKEKSKVNHNGQFYLKHYPLHLDSQTDESHFGASFNQYNRVKYMKTQSSLANNQQKNDESYS